MDVSMPGIGGLAALERLLARYPRARVLMLSAHEDVQIPNRALRAGALGYLGKTCQPGRIHPRRASGRLWQALSRCKPRAAARDGTARRLQRPRGESHRQGVLGVPAACPGSLGSGCGRALSFEPEYRGHTPLPHQAEAQRRQCRRAGPDRSQAGLIEVAPKNDMETRAMNHPVLEVMETIVLLSPADEPWRRIGRFDDMSWHPAIAGLEMLDGAASDAGARRRFSPPPMAVNLSSARRTRRGGTHLPLPHGDFATAADRLRFDDFRRGARQGRRSSCAGAPPSAASRGPDWTTRRCAQSLRDLPRRPRCPSHGKLRSPAPVPINTAALPPQVRRIPPLRFHVPA